MMIDADVLNNDDYADNWYSEESSLWRYVCMFCIPFATLQISKHLV